MATTLATGVLLRRERLVALGSVLGIAAIAWFYLWRETVRMSSTSMESAMMADASQVWSLEWLLATFIMWTIMMAGMMLPSAAPAIVLYGSLVRKHRDRGSMLPSAWVFTSGYLAAWTAFSLAVTFLQAALQAGALMTPMMASDDKMLNGSLLIAAGLYQWLPAKDACLEKCRNPLQLFLFRWRPGASGAFRMGVEHGMFCIGCCWALMLLLFAAGVMNLLSVMLIAGYVLVEKLFPAGQWTGRVTGIALVVAGGVVVA